MPASWPLNSKQTTKIARSGAVVAIKTKIRREARIRQLEKLRQVSSSLAKLATKMLANLHQKARKPRDGRKSKRKTSTCRS